MAEVMEPLPREFGRLEVPLESVRDVAAVQWPPDWRREDEPALVPEPRRQPRLVRLARPMPP
jgi:hypothetical protein